MKNSLFPLMMTAILALVACGPGPTPLPTVPPSPMLTVLPSPTPTVPPSPTPTVPPTPVPTAEPSCPEPTEGTQLLRNEAMGYCLLYPADYIRVDPLPYEVCLVPGEPFLLCHSAQAFFNVEDAAGRSASQVADEITASGGVVGERSSLTIAGVEAVVLPEVAGQVSTRVVIFVYDDRLYKLAFGLPDAADPASVDRSALYNTVIESFTFLPVAPPPEPTEPSQGARGSAVVAYIKDGDVLVWEEATGQNETVFDSGDVVRVELSSDGQLVAFVRGKSALWVVGRNGEEPRELVSADELRARLKASETENVELPCLEWIPNTHRLLYSGLVTPPFVGIGCQQAPTRGLYLLDADALASAEIVPPEEYVREAVPSPDGEHIGLLYVSPEARYFVNVDESLAGQITYIRSAGAPPGEGLGWTQDSTALLVAVGGQVFTIWRVPVDGAAAQPLITLDGDREQLAPDGSAVAFVRSTSPGGVYSRFFVPLPEDLGPLAVIRDVLGLGDVLGLSWSPGGPAYIFEPGQETLLPLCPNAAQAIEVCEPSIPFGEPIQWLEWLDRERFLYLTYVPRRLKLGSLDGSRTLIAEDPHAPPNANVLTIALSFAAVASTCSDDSEFVSDVTVPDGTHFAPDTFFQKTWRVRNTGTCAWDASYRLTYLSGDRMSGPRSAPLGAVVQPGEEVDLSVMLIAPDSAGIYRGQWQMFAPDGTPFGTAPYVVIQVP